MLLAIRQSVLLETNIHTPTKCSANLVLLLKVDLTGYNVQLQFQFLRSSEIKAEVVGGLRATWAEITKPPAHLFTDP